MSQTLVRVELECGRAIFLPRGVRFDLPNCEGCGRDHGSLFTDPDHDGDQTRAKIVDAISAVGSACQSCRGTRAVPDFNNYFQAIRCPDCQDA